MCGVAKSARRGDLKSVRRGGGEAEIFFLMPLLTPTFAEFDDAASKTVSFQKPRGT